MRSIFQSTHPVRGATDVGTVEPNYKAISIHAPRAGCDNYNDGVTADKEIISIHAPRAGCDHTAGFKRFLQADFNPRTPCGVRLKLENHSRSEKRFQSTHPVRGATAVVGDNIDFLKISIHAPRAGCDLTFDAADGDTFISIHAPRAGCDASGTVKGKPED